MRTGILLAIGGLAFLAGCGDIGNTPPKAEVKAPPKPPYQLEFDAKTPKPTPVGIALPGIRYTANTQALERRTALVVRFEAPDSPNGQPARNQMIMAAVDTPDTGGSLPASYIDSADKGLATMLKAACMNGKVKVKVVLVRSSIKPDADDGEIDEKRLSDWVPIDVVFKNPHPKC